MAKDKSRPDNEPENEPEDTSGENTSPEGSEHEAMDGVIEAEGPDIETSSTDPDLSFLDAAFAQLDADSPDAILAAERLSDLQRVTAEYANYRKRTEANREAERERTVGEVVKVLLPVLDDVFRAEKHGDLVEGPFLAISQKLRAGVERLGLTSFGEVGDAFDPQVHEAIFQQPTPDATSETIADVVETGYYLGSTLLRAAKVVVAVPNG